MIAGRTHPEELNRTFGPARSETSPFGRMPDGTPVPLVSLTAGAYTAEVIAFGAALRRFSGPDREGRTASVVLGYRSLETYLLAQERQGAIMGRYVNRIGGGAFFLDGERFALATNEGSNTIHGGDAGFDRRVWTFAGTWAEGDSATAQFELFSPHRDQGFPGNFDLRVRYSLSRDGSLSIAYRARTDRPTIHNLTNHAYFNLAGEGSGSIEDHILQIHADRYLPVDEAILPTGAIASVADTPFDFRTPRRMGETIRADDEQVRFGRGFDHCYVLPGETRDMPRLAARAIDPRSGRKLEVSTTEPGLQLHSGNVLTGAFCGDSGRAYRQTDAFCLEAQHFPDSPNHSHFPSVILKPGETFRATTIYRLGVDDELSPGPFQPGSPGSSAQD